jgi:hypothetical protein
MPPPAEIGFADFGIFMFAGRRQRKRGCVSSPFQLCHLRLD